MLSTLSSDKAALCMASVAKQLLHILTIILTTTSCRS